MFMILKGFWVPSFQHIISVCPCWHVTCKLFESKLHCVQHVSCHKLYLDANLVSHIASLLLVPDRELKLLPRGSRQCLTEPGGENYVKLRTTLSHRHTDGASFSPSTDILFSRRRNMASTEQVRHALSGNRARWNCLVARQSPARSFSWLSTS